MHVDIANALAATASPGVSRAALERLDDQVATAHDRIERGIDAREHGYAALALPEDVDLEEIRETTRAFPDTETLLNVGIGGSALGAATITDALDAESGVDAHYLDNVDPEWLTALLDEVDLASTTVNVVSRSGTTAETLANFLVVRDAFEDAGVDWTDRTFVTTGESGPLRRLADRHDLPTLPQPDGVPGRFAALSTVGLAAASVCGHDLDALVAGASEQRETLGPSLFDAPGYAYGAVAYALDCRGANVNAMMPYAESLETFAEWFAQLWAESLGKDGLGQTPARALGATDQHSQLQLYRAGPRDKLVTLVHPGKRDDREIPETDADELSYLAGTGLGDLADAEFDATEASLAAAGRPSVRVALDRVDEHELGALLYAMEAACVLAGELYAVDTFVQPAVEWGKNAARGLLGEGDYAEADAVADKDTLVVD
ncbi:glucose-6-phosphate isomerase [Halorubellus sp. JP-L1]|uniref:glucose-6-phosphate isomerase n=1 Tax=Halorubellus sp. JP-L1 TaxID=2715753 RepID=UPI00140A4C16|nr:glucose-6-phosphate isomerase [Halorubellus sp. JP-L1]NHN41552.1 glucose-6-phosphate isomerase [Halorubellus sp. JP-L1]